MIKGLLIVLAIWFLFLSVIFCAVTWREHNKEDGITECGETVRIFMHNPGEYSAMINKEGQILVVNLGYARVMTDAEKDKAPWYQIVKSRDGNFKRATIHIHSPEEVEGGGWQKGGKYKKQGSTTVIE